MDLTLYNTLTHKKEKFKPLKKGVVGLYACGPTVYGPAHIGNLRTYVFEDILRRTLEQAGYTVTHVVNITDVEDKIIRNAKRAEQPIGAFVKPHEKAFFEDLKRLHIKKASVYPRATKHIKEMITIISTLLKKKLAYEADGSVYYDISRFKPYGRLSRLSARSLKTSARVDADEYAKNDAQDFVLWKAKKEGGPSWKAPFGEGRPGWHIECSAMSMKYLGATFDIHAGGVDLIFPHHENEIAQSEGATGKPFARYFIEGEHLLVEGNKMSKSLGNTYTLADIANKGFDPLDFRYLTLTAHYRTKLNFTWESLAAARTARRELATFMQELRTAAKRAQGKNPYQASLDTFHAALADDLNTPKALGIVWTFIKQYRKSKDPSPAWAVHTMLAFDSILGLNLAKTAAKATVPPRAVQELLKKREEARQSKRWQEADDFRTQIEQHGWTIKDTPDGPMLENI